MWSIHFLSHRLSLSLHLFQIFLSSQGFFVSSLLSFFPDIFCLIPAICIFHMLLMEGNLGSETPPPVTGDKVCGHHLTRWNSDATSTLTAENCKDSFRHPKNVTPDECTWTNEKHNSYLHHLEMSFVEQLHQSKSVLARFSEHNIRDINVSRRQLMNKNSASNQNDVLQTINCTAAEPIPCSNSAGSKPSLVCKRTHDSKHRGVHCHPSPTKVPTSRTLIGTWLQGKEGTGQNFLDELNPESQAKKLKVALGDGSLQDQIVPSREYLPAAYFSHQ